MMSTIKTTENEFRSQVTSWLNAALAAGGYPFESASEDPGLATVYGARFPDVALWINRAAKTAFCGWELKQPTVQADDSALIENAIEKAEHLGARYFVTWNMRDAILWEATDYGKKQAARLKTYPALAITSAEDLHVPTQKNFLEERAREILSDLARLSRDGHLTYAGADDQFFIRHLTDTAHTIRPFFEQRLADLGVKDRRFQSRLDEWAVKQGFAVMDREHFFEIVSRQIVYQLLGRLLFVEVLRRFQTHLKPIVLDHLSEERANQELRERFVEVRAIDYQAIFEEDLPDTIAVPRDALPALVKLLHDFSRRDFGNLPQEVLGSVFENLIPPEERHRLGQYFTREDLVDFITAFCVRKQDDYVLDPTCGTGTFLIRAYNRLRWDLDVRDHQRILSHIWGVDIAPFPAELATINLYRQDIGNIGNFPRILKNDFFRMREGQEYEFPPNKPIAGDPTCKIHEVFPRFDAIIGNPPYIRQEQIDRVLKTYSKETILPALAKDRSLLAPDRGHIAGQMDPVEISGQADIYAAMFIHAAALLKEGGRLGFVTSNSWLGAEYGKELQAFFLRHFKIVALAESRVEPWFETAQVNTVFIILERCENKTERDRHLAKFISVKKKLSELIPEDMRLDAANRWHHLNKLITKIERTGSDFIVISEKGEAAMRPPRIVNDFEDGDFRIRAIQQICLAEELPKQFGAGHWGRFLRAPSVYFALREKLGDNLASLADEEVAEINYGLKPGITDFFTVSKERAKEFGIEKEYLPHFITSFREIEKPIIDPKDAPYRLFSCHQDINELRRLGKGGALKYIQWGEQQKTTGRGAVGRAGVPWPQAPSVQNRPRWYDIGEHKPGDIAINQFIGERIFFPLNPRNVFVSNAFFEIRFRDPALRDLWAALMNSSLFYLFVYTHGRVDWSQGPLRIYGPEIRSLFLPDARKIAAEHREKILSAFAPLLKRKIKKISEEVKQKDRHAFDAAVLEALGLDPAEYLNALYRGLADLVRARVMLGKMQAVEKKTKRTRDTAKIKEEVMREIIPDGLRPFPESFASSRAKRRQIAVPAGKIRMGAYFMGKQAIVNERGETYEASSQDQADFIVYAQKPDSNIIAVPESAIDIKKALQKYRIYLKELREELMQAFSNRTGDESIAEHLTAEVMEELGASA